MNDYNLNEQNLVNEWYHAKKNCAGEIARLEKMIEKKNFGFFSCENEIREKLAEERKRLEIINERIEGLLGIIRG